MTPNVKHLEPLAVDAANGVGALKLAYMRQTLTKYLRIEIFNDGSKGHLNEKVNEKRKKRQMFLLENLFSVVLIMLNFIKKHRMVYH